MQGQNLTEANTNDLIVDVFIKAAIIEEDECNSSWCCAADEEHHDGDEHQHQHPLLGALQGLHPPPPCPGPEFRRLFLAGSKALVPVVC